MDRRYYPRFTSLLTTHVTIEYKSMIKILKKELTLTMNLLINRPDEKKIIQIKLNDDRLCILTRCLINIVFEYIWISSCVKFIDWNNIKI